MTRQSPRTRLAARALLATASSSRMLGRGSGSTVGGRVGLLIDPRLLGRLAAGRQIALVSGTNGKTTTTRLLCEALGGPSQVASAPEGANMPAGSRHRTRTVGTNERRVLEVDEGYLIEVAGTVTPDVIVLLNLSRDELDRVSEVRMIANRWRDGLATSEATLIVNADDPLIVWSAELTASVIWVAAGAPWHLDAFHCPRRDARITFGGIDDVTADWSCSCGFRRPEPDVRLIDGQLTLPDGRRLPVTPRLPGRFNQANATMAAVAASAFGVEIARALELACRVSEVAGRFTVIRHGDATARLLLAKNPAGWSELVELVRADDAPIVIAINSRIADGHDPSWLWDVPFELLAGRQVIATGDRRWDLAVRLRHAGIAHRAIDDPLAALEAAHGPGVEFIGNYTAFQDLRARLAGASRPRKRPARNDANGAFPAAVAVVETQLVGQMNDDPFEPAGRKEQDLAIGPFTTISGRSSESALRIVIVHPDLLSTYGDNGNGRVLANRAYWRDLAVELVLAPSDRVLPTSGDLYCIGGGEDGPQVRSAEQLREGSLATAVSRGALVLAVCAGYQVIGRSFPGSSGTTEHGVGLLDIETVRLEQPRVVGEVRATMLGADWPGSRDLSGFENHAGRTRLGAGVEPLAALVSGVGNGDGRSEGAFSGRVYGTYLHGPVLARNPAFADFLLQLATGELLGPLEDLAEHALRAERRHHAEHVTGRRHFVARSPHK